MQYDISLKYFFFNKLQYDLNLNKSSKTKHVSAQADRVESCAFGDAPSWKN